MATDDDRRFHAVADLALADAAAHIVDLEVALNAVRADAESYRACFLEALEQIAGLTTRCDRQLAQIRRMMGLVSGSDDVNEAR